MEIIEYRDTTGKVITYTTHHYRGYLTATKRHVVLQDGDLLDPRRSLAVRSHSPDGFAWGYSGSGPAQLALALLLEELGLEEAVEHYQDFKFSFIAGLPSEQAWEMTSEHIWTWWGARVRCHRAAALARARSAGLALVVSMRRRWDHAGAGEDELARALQQLYGALSLDDDQEARPVGD